MFLKVIACEIAARELYYTASCSPILIDFELLTQGYHDIPNTGRVELQKRIDAVPEAKYDAVLLGYGLCSSILPGLAAKATQLVIPRAHDCITFFLGSKERYQQCFSERPGTYYFSSGWLEYAKRRGNKGTLWAGASVGQFKPEPQSRLRTVAAKIRRGTSQVFARRDEPVDRRSAHRR